MSAPCLVTHIAGEGTLIHEERSEFFCRRKHAAAIAAHVNDESVAERQCPHHLMEVAAAKPIFKRGTTHVADVVVKDAIRQTGSDGVIGGAPEIGPDDGVGIIHRMVVKPFAVARCPHSRREVDMPVTEFTCQVR